MCIYLEIFFSKYQELTIYPNSKRIKLLIINYAIDLLEPFHYTTQQKSCSIWSRQNILKFDNPKKKSELKNIVVYIYIYTLDAKHEWIPQRQLDQS